MDKTRENDAPKEKKHRQTEWKDVDNRLKVADSGSEKSKLSANRRPVSTSEISDLRRWNRMERQKRDLPLPAMEGFDKLDTAQKKELEKFMAEKIPEKHLNQIRIERITTDAMSDSGEIRRLSTSKSTKALWEGRPENAPKVMHVPEAAQENVDMEKIKDAITEAAAQDAYDRLEPSKRAEWDRIMPADKRSAIQKEFQEAYKQFALQPNTLKTLDKERYEFMKNEIF